MWFGIKCECRSAPSGKVMARLAAARFQVPAREFSRRDNRETGTAGKFAAQARTAPATVGECGRVTMPLSSTSSGRRRVQSRESVDRPDAAVRTHRGAAVYGQWSSMASQVFPRIRQFCARRARDTRKTCHFFPVIPGFRPFPGRAIFFLSGERLYFRRDSLQKGVAENDG